MNELVQRIFNTTDRKDEIVISYDKYSKKACIHVLFPNVVLAKEILLEKHECIEYGEIIITISDERDSVSEHFRVYIKNVEEEIVSQWK